MGDDESREAPVSRELDRSPRARAMRAPLATVKILEDLVHYAVIAVLFVVAGIVLYRTVADLLQSHNYLDSSSLGVAATEAVNGVLFAVIVMELLHTVMAHFERGGFQLQPFLIIGIISAVRHILTVGARLTLGGKLSPEEFGHAQIEFGVNAGVVLALAIGLVLVRRSGKTAD